MTLYESSAAMRKVNETLLEYFDERQLLVFRAAVLYAILSHYLRGKIGKDLNFDVQRFL